MFQTVSEGAEVGYSLNGLSLNNILSFLRFSEEDITGEWQKQ